MSKTIKKSTFDILSGINVNDRRVRTRCNQHLLPCGENARENI